MPHLNIFISSELPLLEACKFQQIRQGKKKSNKNSSIVWSNSTSEVAHFQILYISNSLLSGQTTVTNLAELSIGPDRVKAPEASISGSQFFSAWVKWKKMQFIFPEAKVAYFPGSSLFSFSYFKSPDRSQHCCVARSHFWWLIISMAWGFTETVSRNCLDSYLASAYLYTKYHFEGIVPKKEIACSNFSWLC